MSGQPVSLMEPADVWGVRWEACDNSMVRQYMDVVCKKQTLVILAADLVNFNGLMVT